MKTDRRVQPPGPLYRRLSTAVAEMKAIRAGTARPARVWELVPDGSGGFIRRQVTPPSKPSISTDESKVVALEARQKLGLSQEMFAALLGVSAGTLRGWEQGRRQPNKAARVLLRVAVENPRAVLDAAKRAA